MGDAIGRSRLAKKDGPLAFRFPEPGSVSWKAIEPYWRTVDIYGGGDAFQRTFAEVPQPTGHLLAVTWCHSEICNGGLLQFFMNSTGVLAPEAVQGFYEIGMPALGELVARAMPIFGTPYPRDQAQRRSFLATIGLDAKDKAEREWNPFYDRVS